MPGTDIITLHRGAAYVIPFAMNPVENITGWTIQFNVEASGGQIITKTATVTSGAAGTFTVALTAADTNIRIGTYQYDAWRIDVGSERVLAVGQLVISDVAKYPAVAM